MNNQAATKLPIWVPIWAKTLAPKLSFPKESCTPCAALIDAAKNLNYIDLFVADLHDAEEVALSKEAWKKADDFFKKFNCVESQEYQNEVTSSR
jgi:hypothetical protein